MTDVTSAHAAIDGSPDEIAGHSTYYVGIAEAISTSISKLQTITNTLETTSDAVAAFSDVAAEVATNLGEVHDRYQGIAEQLASFANALRDLKGEANALQAAARQDLHDRNTELHLRKLAWDDYTATDPQSPDHSTNYHLYLSHKQNVEELGTSIAARQTSLDQLIEDWRQAADSCADAINSVVNGSSLNDSWWDKFVSWMEDVLPDLEFILDIVSIVLTVVAFVLVLTGVGAPIAAALFAIARIVQLVSKALTIIRLVITVVEVARGKRPLTDLIAFAVEAAINKVGGKLIPGAAKKALGGSKDFLLKKLKNVGASQFKTNAKKLVNKGFDQWTDDVMEPFLKKGMKNSPFAKGLHEFAEGAERVTDGMKLGVEATASGILSAGATMPVNISSIGAPGTLLGMFAGPENVIADLSWDGLQLANEAADRFDLPSIDVGEFMFGDPESKRHPSYESLVGAS